MTDEQIINVDEQIIKALECCIESECDSCPYDEQTACVEYVKQGAIDIINRQKMTIDAAIAGQETLQKHIVEKDKEIEMLQKENERFADIGKLYSEIRNEVIKEFWDKLKEKACTHNCRYKGNVYDITAVETKDGDNLVKEMVGETDV